MTKTFETIRGVELPIQPVGIFDLAEERKRTIEEFFEERERLPRPTYAAELAGGAKEYHEHTQESIDHEHATDEERALWEAWQEQQDELRRAVDMRLNRLRLVEGVTLDPPEDRAWEEKRKRRGYDIPEPDDDPDEYKYHWLLYEFLVSNDELVKLLLAIIRLNSPIEEAAAVAADGFQRAMETPGRAEAGEAESVSEEEGLDGEG
jgi:hypothetical protein